MSFITTKFHEILSSGFRGVALTRKTGLTDWLTDWLMDGSKTLYPPQLVAWGITNPHWRLRLDVNATFRQTDTKQWKEGIKCMLYNISPRVFCGEIGSMGELWVVPGSKINRGRRTRTLTVTWKTLIFFMSFRIDRYKNPLRPIWGKKYYHRVLSQ